MAAGTSNAAPVTENVTNNEGKVRCVCALRELYHFLYMICWNLFIVMEFFL